MSLQVWLPLTKDLRQQGLDSVFMTTNTGATFVSNGKLGGCYSFDSIDDWIQGTFDKTKYSGKPMSLACWFKSDKSDAGGAIIDLAADLCLGYTYNSSGIKFTAWRCYKNSSNNRAGSSSVTSTYYNADDWHHIVDTFEGGVEKIYVDGILSQTFDHTNLYTYNWTPLLASYYNKISIGKSAGDSNWIGGLVNDVRIYDHCLSPMEIKQISQGLVLHYPLNRNGWGQENILLNSASEKTGASNSAQWFRWNTNATLTANQTYTLSFDAKMTIATDVFYISWSNNDSTQEVWNQGTQVTTEYKRYSFTGSTTKTNINAILMSNYKGYNRGNNNNTTGVLSVKNVKLEVGDKVTPWSPNSSDTLATTMGLNSTTEYDCSGFCNNGTRNGTFDWTSNTAKYSVSQIFNGSNNAIQTPNLTTMVSDKNYTIACWVYKSVLGSKNYQTIYGGPSGFELEARNGTAAEAKFRIHNWGGGSTAYEFNTWYHFCFVHTASDSKLYINGELKLTGSSAAVPSGNYFVGAWKTATQQNYDGLISDFRIYATALSADDVKSLYQNCATIDPDGTIRGQIRS